MKFVIIGQPPVESAPGDCLLAETLVEARQKAASLLTKYYREHQLDDNPDDAFGEVPPEDWDWWARRMRIDHGGMVDIKTITEEIPAAKMKMPPLDKALIKILTSPPFLCLGLIDGFEEIGMKVPQYPEERHAWFIHWALDVYFEHGPEKTTSVLKEKLDEVGKKMQKKLGISDEELNRKMH